MFVGVRIAYWRDLRSRVETISEDAMLLFILLLWLVPPRFKPSAWSLVGCALSVAIASLPLAATRTRVTPYDRAFMIVFVVIAVYAAVRSVKELYKSRDSANGRKLGDGGGVPHES
jgi:hypothetical protein